MVASRLHKRKKIITAIHTNPACKNVICKGFKSEHKVEQLWKGKQFIIWGMPFYNEVERKQEFEKGFEELIKS